MCCNTRYILDNKKIIFSNLLTYSVDNYNKIFLDKIWIINFLLYLCTMINEIKYNKTSLQSSINIVNKRFEKGLNDDDQVFNMFHIAQYTKGYYIKANYNTYLIITDLEHLQSLVNQFGYWSNSVKLFNEVLTKKGGYDYMTKLNNQITR